MVAIRESIQHFVNDVLKVETMEDMFAGYIINNKENEKFKQEKYKENFNQLILKLKNNELLENGIIEFINSTSEINSKQKNFFFLLLEDAVKQNLLSARIVCQSLLTTEKLIFTNDEFWCLSFNLIFKIIDRADYKEIRDIIKVMLNDILPKIPNSFNVSMLPQVNCVYKVFEYVFNREYALLPAYLVYDEIRKKSNLLKDVSKLNSFHWKFSKLLSDFVSTFKPVANLYSYSGKTQFYPVVSIKNISGNAQIIDKDGKFKFINILPFNEELLKPQINLFTYILKQPYSRDFFLNMLLVKNGRIEFIENVIVEIIIFAMERTEEASIEDQNLVWNLYWKYLPCNLIEFLHYQTHFHKIVEEISNIVVEKNLKKGRDYLIWFFLQFVSAAISKFNFSNFFPFIKLIDVLYDEKEPLPLPDLTNPLCANNFAAASFWILLMRKAENENIKLMRKSPIILINHIEFLKQNMANTNFQNSLGNDYKVAIFGNAFQTNADFINKLAKFLVDSFTYVIRNYNNGNNQSNNIPPQTLSVSLFDSFTVHFKVTLTQNIINLILNQLKNNMTSSISPILLETYSRLFVYSRTENIIVKNFLSQCLTNAFHFQAWNAMHNLLEMWSFRTFHIKLNYRIQLLTWLTNMKQPNHQLQQIIEHASLKLILGLNLIRGLSLLSELFQNQPNEVKNLVSSDSEELNKILVLTFSRDIQLTSSETLSSSHYTELLTTIMQSTSFSWSSSTIQCFPPVIQNFYNQNQIIKDNRMQLTFYVDEEYRKFVSMSNENELIQHFTQPSIQPVFLCIMWRLLLETNQINPIAFKVLEKFGPKLFNVHLRSLADYLVNEFAKSSGQQVTKFIDSLNDLIWKYNVVTLDKLFLFLALRPFEGNDLQVCLFIIQQVLFKNNEFKNRVNDFVKELSPEFWLQSNWQEKHSEYLRKYPEKYFFETTSDQQQSAFPHYFSNVCLRFLPVLDIIIHRCLENSATNTNSIETILDQMAYLYKFHEQPITFLYNTLHYYEFKFRTKPSLKKKLVSSILGAFKDIRPKNWALSEQYINYINTNKDSDWNPDLDYYLKLVGRFVDTLDGKQVFHNFDWRFNEFTNVGCHALHVTCVELLALPKYGNVVANSLIDIVMVGQKTIPRSSIMSWINVIGMILTYLPEVYWSVLNERILQIMESSLLTDPNKNEDIFKILDFNSTHYSLSELQIGYLIALCHSFYHHSFIGQVSLLSQFLYEKIKPIIKTEEQFIFICQIVLPFLQRLSNERTRIMCDIARVLYEMLEIVDKNSKELYYIDPICDLLYYLKYTFTGDSVKNEIESSIRNLRTTLQMRLSFIARIPKESSN